VTNATNSVGYRNRKRTAKISGPHEPCMNAYQQPNRRCCKSVFELWLTRVFRKPQFFSDRL